MKDIRDKIKAFLILALVGGAFMRLALIGRDMLWYDEVYTAKIVRLPLEQMVSTTIGDVHPPTWYFIEKAFVAVLGESEFSLRLPAAILGVLAIWLTWRLALSVHHSLIAALFAAMLMAVSPFAVYYANEARMYSLLIVAVLLALIGAVERRGWLLAAGLALTLLTHNMAVIYAPAIGLIAWRRMGFKRAAAWCALGTLPYLLWLPSLISQVARLDTKGYWIDLFSNNLLATLVYHLTNVLFLRFGPDDLLLQYSIVTLALIVFPVWAAVKRGGEGGLLMALAAFLPPALMLAVSLAWKSMILYRVLAGMLPPWLVLIAWWAKPSMKDSRPAKQAMFWYIVFMVIVCHVTYDIVGRNDMSQRYVAWIRDNLPATETLCHYSPMVEYYTGRPVRLDLDQCDDVMFFDFPTIPTELLQSLERRAQQGTVIYEDATGQLVYPIRIYRLPHAQ